MAKKVYAVRKGHVPGLYYNWDECKAQVNGFSGAEYKSFNDISQADAYMRGVDFTAKRQTNVDSDKKGLNEAIFNLSDKPYAFVDGSYNADLNIYGYGGVVVINKEPYIVAGSTVPIDDREVEMAGMRNVAGEIEGAMAAINKAKELGAKELSIYYDYAGIEKWATGEWKCNKLGTKEYRDFINTTRDEGMDISFVKVKAHSGITGNEIVDNIAKKSVGLPSKPIPDFLMKKERRLPKTILPDNETQDDCEFE